MKKLILAAAAAMAISLCACGPKAPTGDVKADAKYLVEQCVKAQKEGKDEQAEKLTGDFMQFYRDKGTAEAAEFAFTVLGELSNLPPEDQQAVKGF